jgi:Flp pilus assembly protein TadB
VPRASRRLSVRALQLIAGGAACVGSVLLLGVVRGAAGALVLAPTAALVVTRLANRPSRAPPDASLALALDLAAASLRAGQPIAAALTLAAPAASTAAPGLLRAAGLLRLGAPAAEAWAELAADPALAPVARLAARSADSGIRLAAGLEQLAADVRAQLRSAAQSRAHRAGIWAVAPLGLCFLPAFVCLGIVPVVVGVARLASP